MVPKIDKPLAEDKSSVQITKVKNYYEKQATQVNVCWVSSLVERKGKESGGWKIGNHEVTQPVSAGIVGQQINDKNIFSISSIFSTATLQ